MILGFRTKLRTGRGAGQGERRRERNNHIFQWHEHGTIFLPLQLLYVCHLDLILQLSDDEELH